MHRTIARLSSAALCAAAVLWMSGCRTQLRTPFGAVAPPVPRAVELSPATPSAATPSAGATGESHAGCSPESTTGGCRHWTVLVGYPVEEARQRARAAGFTGKIDVNDLPEHDGACKDGVVCRATPDYWELNQGETLTLLVNRKVAISAPNDP